MAEDVAIVTHAACVRLAGVERCGLLRDRMAMQECYQETVATARLGGKESRA